MLSSGSSLAESRIALLIGNQAYNEKVGPLKNPHNDIARVGAALEKVGFKVTRIKDAGYKAIDTALKQHIQQVRRAGKDTISFVYYSGHGAADPDTQINYLIPIDVTSADDAEVWTNSLDLREIVNRLREQSPNAVHFVIFDACREELRLTRDGTKALERKGFVPVANISGVMIAYATAPGKTASDAGDGGGVYAKTLAEEIVTPGVESVMMFRTVHETRGLSRLRAFGLGIQRIVDDFCASVSKLAPWTPTAKDQSRELWRIPVLARSSVHEMSSGKL